MVDGTAILVDNISKRYRIGQGGPVAYQTLRESLIKAIRAPFHRLQTGRVDRQKQTIWALKEVSFEIPQGQAVGIIGRNGAGKSTLLKILSRITPPTQGTVDLYGRVGSLLEVGTGFHPELTGRENIFLNGAILGMKRIEIERKFDEMVAFAEFEQFIDTPVKYYSSGMYMRLAFSVAAHLEPEILLVDEVLSVGDAAFQKKAIGKMGDVARGGRTVLFVSHNLDVVFALTSRSIVLDSGHLVFDGSSNQAIQYYRQSISDSQEATKYQSPNKKIGLIQARVITSEPNGVHRFGQKLEFEFKILLNKQILSFDFAFQVLNEHSMPVINPRWVDMERKYSHEKMVTIRCILPKPRLYMGQYTLRTNLGDRASTMHYETVESICDFEVVMDGVPNPTNWPPGACAYMDDTLWQIDPDLRGTIA